MSIYSILVLEKSDFESSGHEMLKVMGVDSSVACTAAMAKNRKNVGSVKRKRRAVIIIQRKNIVICFARNTD